MSRKCKLSDKEMVEAKEMYESGVHSNSAVARLFKHKKVTEKNIRDWAKQREWLKVGVVTPKEKKDLAQATPKKRKPKSKKLQKEENFIELVESSKPISNEEMSSARDMVVELIVSLQRETYIRRYMKVKLGIYGEIFNIIFNSAKTVLAKGIEKNLDYRFNLHIEARLKLYRKFEDSGDLKSAYMVLMDMAKLEGLYPKDPRLLVPVESNKKIFALQIPEEYQNDAFVVDVIKDDSEQ